MKNEDGKNLLPRGPKMLPGKTQAGRPVPVGGKNVDDDFKREVSPAPGGAVKLPAPAGGKGRPAPAGRIAKLPAPAGSKGMPRKTQSVVNRVDAKRAAIKRMMGPKGY
jgi:hypothetical protein